MALDALAGLVVLRVVPAEAVPDLWSRASARIFFLHTYWDSFRAFLHYPGTAEVIYRTLGVRRLVTRALVVLLHDDDSPARQICPLLWHLLHNGLEEEENFQEIVDALDNVADIDLASLILKEMSQVLSAPKSHNTVASVGSIMGFLSSTENRQGFQSSLLDRGIVAATIRALLALVGIYTSATSATIEACFVCLFNYMKRPPRYRWLAEALHAGLLRVIIIFATTLVSYAVATQMKAAIYDVRLLSQSPTFLQSTLAEDWNKLQTVVEARARALDDWDKGGRKSFRACDNMKVGSVHHRYNADHWRPRERAFMRATLHMDYRRVRPAVAVHSILFMAEHPGRPFCVFFDYSQWWDPEIRVIGADQLPALPGYEAELPIASRVLVGKWRSTSSP
ncbi:hypothetical protein DFH07DRAFT_999502 [Mycena maculata]|uniref:Uncharacterized protein n=1 Tax=Mycena maculata TaxID=230809 RepID=A0AAD7NQW0_9AGAR|nr:hypothetical protein DFH07DRAFT_999502 [Mycena maculata]